MVSTQKIFGYREYRDKPLDLRPPRSPLSLTDWVAGCLPNGEIADQNVPPMHGRQGSDKAAATTKAAIRETRLGNKAAVANMSTIRIPYIEK